MKGFLITFEGIEGTGKSTQARALCELLEKQGLPVHMTREPGGTRIGDMIRELLLNPDNNEMSSMTEILLYAASRAQLVHQFLRPYLEEGYIVICDRFVDSTIAYQAFGRGIPVNVIREINSAAVWNIVPNITFYLDLEPEASVRRVRLRVEETEEIPDRLEREKIDFFRKVREGYMSLIKDEPFRFRVLDASLEPREVHKKIVEITERELKKANLYRLREDGGDQSFSMIDFSID